MRRILIGALFAGGGVLLARSLAPRLHERMLAGCERFFEQMPDDFPPRRILRGVEETRSNTARILSLLEKQREATGEAEPTGDVSIKPEGHAA